MDELMSLLFQFAVIALVTLLVLTVIEIIARWKLFSKAGEAGWKALIPFYSDYVLYKISNSVVFFLVYYIVVIMSAILSGITSGSEVSTLVLVVSTLLGFVSFACQCVQSIRLTKAFGQGVGMGILLILFRPVVMLVLAFGSSTYTKEITE